MLGFLVDFHQFCICDAAHQKVCVCGGGHTGQKGFEEIDENREQK